MSTLNKNIHQAIQDFDSIQQAIIDKGVEVPSDTPTSEYDEKIREIETGITPSGTIEINENGAYDVTQYAQAEVDVPQPSGKINITENGTDIDVAQYALADVNIEPVINITCNTETVDNDVFLTSVNEEIKGNIVAEIPDGTTKIARNAMVKNAFIDTVIMPNSVNEIQDGEYYINLGAFAQMPRLSRVVLSENITKIGAGAFAYDSSLTTLVNFPAETLQYIGEDAFYNTKCFSGITLNLPNVNHIKSQAFRESNVEAVIVSTLESIGQFAFSNSSLTLFDFGECYIEHIPDYCFAGCHNLTTMVLSPYTIELGSECFSGSNLLSSIDTSKIEQFGSSCFRGCSSLTNIATDSAQIFANDSLRETGIVKLKLGDSVAVVVEHAFHGCEALTILVISHNFSGAIEQDAFMDCSSLTTAYIPKTISNVDFLRMSNTEIYFDGTRAEWQNIPGSNHQIGTIHYEQNYNYNDL